MIQDVEDALGEFEFKDGIPDVKFSRVRMTSLWCYQILLLCLLMSVLKSTLHIDQDLFLLIISIFVLKVLGKIWSVALKYNFRMPSYYTLVLRSLASLEGRLSHATFASFISLLTFSLLCMDTENLYSAWLCFCRILHLFVLFDLFPRTYFLIYITYEIYWFSYCNQHIKYLYTCFPIYMYSHICI